jgi:hypothetical protein
MKSRHLALPIVPFLFCVAAFSQADPSKPAPAASQQSFEKLKALAGSWVGTYEGKPEDVSLRVTSSGNALMHEATQVGVEADPITFFYLEEDRLLLTHYCDAGNRPRMVEKVSPDGKTIEFELLEVEI